MRAWNCAPKFFSLTHAPAAVTCCPTATPGAVPTTVASSFCLSTAIRSTHLRYPPPAPRRRRCCTHYTVKRVLSAPSCRTLCPPSPPPLH